MNPYEISKYTVNSIYDAMGRLEESTDDQRERELYRRFQHELSVVQDFLDKLYEPNTRIKQLEELVDMLKKRLDEEIGLNKKKVGDVDSFQYYDKALHVFNPEFYDIAANSGLMTEFLGHLRAGRKIDSIKLYRNIAGAGLKESKDFVESYFDFLSRNPVI